MNDRWIPITESLPDADLTVLVATDPAHHSEPVWLGYLDGDTWREANGEPAFVTHWRALPEPPVTDPVLSDDLCDAYGVPRGSRRSEVDDNSGTPGGPVGCLLPAEKTTPAGVKEVPRGAA
jgi:hypothetical protein